MSFITFYTPTYRRPQQLARCLASVAAQTCVEDIDQIVIPDHVGRGVGGMYARVPRYAGAACHSRYVMFLCDDDVLAGESAIAQVRAFVDALDGDPPVVIVMTQKGGDVWPAGNPWPPTLGAIDLNCAIVRSDVWLDHVRCYGERYEGDFDFLEALYAEGYPAVWCPILVSRGAVSREAVEALA